MAYYTAGVIGSYIRSAVTASGFDISESTVRATNLLTSGTIRDTAGTLDISGGNIYISGTLTQSGGGSTSNLIVPGYIRNALTPTTLDISGGNISNSGDHIAGSFTTVNSLTSNVIGGVILESSNISNTGTTLSGKFTTISASSNDIGGVTLSNSNVTLAGTITGSTANTSNSIGGVTLSNTNLTLAGTITGSTSNTSNRIGGVTLSNNNLTLAGGITGSTDDTSNRIGGVVMSNTNLRLAGAITGTTVDTLNYIGGVTLSNTSLSLAGAITGLTADSFNQIGGVTLSNNNIVTSGTLQFNSGDSDKLYWTTVGLMGSKVAHSAGWSVDMYAGSNGTNTGTFRFLRGATTGGGSAESLRITSNGQVGIGTVAPAYALDVSSTSAIAQAIFRNPSGQQAGIYVTGAGSSDLSGLQMYHQASDQGLYHNNSNPFYIWTKNVRRVAIDQSGNVGIGSGTDGLRNYRLAVRGTGATTAGVVFANSGNQTPFVGMVYDEPNEALSFRTNTGTTDLNCNAVTIKRAGATAGFMGINTNTPLYRLDISEAPTAASINLGTWPRMNTTSNFFWVRGHCNATVATYRIRWNTTNSNVPNTNIMTWADNATHGSYFQILKSGIWTINYVVQCAGTGLSWVDASSSFSNGYALPITAGVGDLIALGPATGNTLVTSFTGYLPSNSGKFYRFSSTQTNTSGGVGVITPYLTIALLYETPDIVPTFFSP
jgi:hypothetical protein